MTSTLDELKVRIDELARKINAPHDLLPTYGYSIDGAHPHIELTDGQLYYIIVERGEELKRVLLKNTNDLFFAVFRDVTFSMAVDFEMRHRIQEEDCRRQIFAKQKELMGALQGKWKEMIEKRTSGIVGRLSVCLRMLQLKVSYVARWISAILLLDILPFLSRSLTQLSCGKDVVVQKVGGCRILAITNHEAMHTIKRLFTVMFVLAFSTTSIAQPGNYTTQQYKDDFDFLWKSINDEYCYFNKKQTDWEKVRQIYAPMIDTVKSRGAFVGIIEKVIFELYDHHCGLNTNTDSSRRLVPTRTDIWAEYVNGKPTIIEVRRNSGADSTQIIAGMQIVAINDIPVEQAVKAFLPKSLKKPDQEANNFALRLALAGNHIEPRKLSLKSTGAAKDYFPDQDGMGLDHFTYNGMVDTKRYGTIGYIRINNCLFDNDLVRVFDSVMLSMKKHQRPDPRSSRNAQWW